MNHIILFGPPGSGKGTQAKILSETLSYKHISTGDLFRYHVKENSSFGLSITSYINRGLLVPDSLTTEMLKETLLKEKEQKTKGFIYDGYPRTITQAESLDKILAESSLGSITKVFVFRAPDGDLVSRILKRAKDSHREDDQDPAIIRKRIREYYEKTLKVSDYYKHRGILVELDALDNIEDISNLIKKEILQA